MSNEPRGRLRELMKSRGLTQVELSSKTGIPQGTISRFDRNTRHEAAHLLALSKFFGICINDLFEEGEDEPNEPAREREHIHS